MKKLFTYLMLLWLVADAKAASHKTFYDWGGMIFTNQDMAVNRVDSDDYGNTYVSMTLRGNADFDFGAGKDEVNYGTTAAGALVKYNANGELIWKKTFHGSGTNKAYEVTVTPNGDVLVSGNYVHELKIDGITEMTGITTTTKNGFVLKFNSTGTLLESMNYTNSGNSYVLGTEVDDQNNIYVTGYSDGFLDLDPGPNVLNSQGYPGIQNSFTAKYDASFAAQWAVAARGPVVVKSQSVTVGPNEVFVGGYIERAGPSSPITITKVNGVASNNIVTTPALRASDGYIIIIDKQTGTPKGFHRVVALGPAANNRMRIFDIDYSDIDNSVVVAADYSGNISTNGKIITGNSSDDKRRGIIMKFSPNSTGTAFNFTWSRILFNLSQPYYPMVISDVDIDPLTGQIATAADSRTGLGTIRHNGTTQGPSSTISTQIDAGNNDGFAIVFNKDGDLVRHLFIGGDFGRSTCVDYNKRVLTVGGFYKGTFDLDVTSSGVDQYNGGYANSIGLSQYSILLKGDLQNAYVDHTATGNDNGTSWSDAFTDLSKALYTASDSVFVARGTYEGGFDIESNIGVFGGFDGSETSFRQRDLDANLTILSGDGRYENVLKVTKPSVILDGLIIEKGTQPLNASTSSDESKGAGILYKVDDSGGDFKIKNCKIRDNFGHSVGAGIFMGAGGNFTQNILIENCHIHDNSSRGGPSYWLQSSDASIVNFDFVNNLVDHNSTEDKPNTKGFTASAGGVILAYNTSNVTATFINSVFADNKNNGSNVISGDALICTGERSTFGHSPQVNVACYNNIFYGNDSKESLGFWESGTFTRMTNLTMRRNFSEDIPDNTYALGTANISFHSTNIDPLFIDPTNRDYSVQTTSTVIDQGDITGISSKIPGGDLAGNQRIAGGVIDIGAYESFSSPVVNIAPVLASIGSKVIMETNLLTFTPIATDANVGDILYYSLDAASIAQGMTINSITGVYSWTPNNSQSGTYNVTISVSDGALSDSETFLITVTDLPEPPVLAPLTDKTVLEADNLSFTASATDPNGGSLTYSLDAASIALGMTINSNTGAFLWTPTTSQSGVYSVTITVSDGALTDSETFDITVIDLPEAPVLATIGSKTVIETNALIFTATAADPNVGDILTYSLDAASIAQGMTINSSTGVYSWTPSISQSGSYNVTVSVTDGTFIDSETFLITVVDFPEPPVLAAITDKTILEGNTLLLIASATDPNGGSLTYSLDAASIALGMTINSNIGLIQWTPTTSQSGVYLVTITVSDGALTDSKTFNITVTDLPEAPILAAIGDQVVRSNRTLTFTATATDPNIGDNLTYSLDAISIAYGMSINANSGFFSWTPHHTYIGTFNVTVTVSDGALTDSETFLVRIGDSARPSDLSPISNMTISGGRELSFSTTNPIVGGDLTDTLDKASTKQGIAIDEEQTDILLLSNPVIGDWMKVSSSESDKRNYWILDLSGQVLQTGMISSTLESIPVSSLSSGIYVFKVSGKTPYTVKFVKK
ncbi:putative Ig domain-containing protein [Reichenbachiella versicolor]|uniref:putative Ig domain-containing protein n=1 Tax=Reichenbachiella versicolor TaxID=1821036 RepID=UPI000D6DEAB4|nr:putative Ig domain-containing protein [Reichenbachiella versicolor]